MAVPLAAGRSVVLAPRRAVRSRAGRLLAPIGVAWAFIALAGGDTLATLSGMPRETRPIAVTVGVVILAFLPLVILFVSTITGPRGRFRGLFERNQPRVIIDAGGVTLSTPRGDRVLVHNQIAGLKKRHPLSGRWLLLDLAGRRLADVPPALVTAIDAANGRVTSLAAAMVAARPDRYVIARRRFEALPLRFRLRKGDEPETDWAAISRARRRVQVFVLAVAGIAGAIVGYLLLS